MKKIVLLSLSVLLLMSCGKKMQTDNEPEQTSVTNVSVVNVHYGQINKEIELTAVTAFLKKNIATAPISSFITACYIQIGTKVHKGQILFRLESKERSALGNDVMGANMGIVNVKASASGIVTDVQQQSGGYVTEGSPLCSIANTNSMAFEVEVPTEDMRYAKSGTSCRIELPDGRNSSAIFSTPLATMDVNAQVQQVPAHARMASLPEGLRAKAILKTTSSGRKTQILPKSAVQCDDNMSSFWIMKAIDKNCAQKIPVTIGNSNNHEIEIISPTLLPSDKIITTGSYQLQDGDKIKIIN